jgi:hypothetical protein
MIANELELFTYLKDRYDHSLQRTQDIFDSYDCYTNKLFIELKCRTWHYDQLLIEKIKYDRLIKESDRLGKTPIYINSTPKGIFGFKIKEIPIEWIEKDLPKTTDFENRSLVKKVIGLIDTKHSTVL